MKAALEWINMLLEKSPSDMGRFISDLLPSLLNALTDDTWDEMTDAVTIDSDAATLDELEAFITGE